MSFIYENNEQLIIEIKKLMLENKISQRQVAAHIGVTPQGFTKLLSKKILVLRMQKKSSRLWGMISL